MSNKTYKVSTIDHCYCETGNLSKCINIFKKKVKKDYKEVFITKIGADIPVPKHNTFAVIGIQRRENEYYLILNYYKSYGNNLKNFGEKINEKYHLERRMK